MPEIRVPVNVDLIEDQIEDLKEAMEIEREAAGGSETDHLWELRQKLITLREAASNGFITTGT
jgi:hypothetical protein